MSQKHVIVIGAGIIGASIAYHLQRAGARVTLVDGQEPGGVASPCSFGWVNASYRNARPYYELRLRAMSLWDRLATQLPGLPYRRSGVLYLDERDYTFDEFHAQHSAWGYDLRWIDAAEIRILEPNLARVPERGLFAASEGAVDADLAARFLAAAAVDAGTTLRASSPVERLVVRNGKVTGVRCGGEDVTADEVVVAAGTETEALAATADVRVPLQSSRGLLIHTTVVAQKTRHVILAEDVHFRQRIDGRFVAGEDFGGGAINDSPESGARLLFDRIRAQLRDSADLELAGYTVGYRPKPIDGHPAVGRVPGLPGLYIAVMHSGATLASAIGHFAAEEIASDQRDPLLAPFGADRFATLPAAASL